MPGAGAASGGAGAQCFPSSQVTKTAFTLPRLQPQSTSSRRKKSAIGTKQPSGGGGERRKTKILTEVEHSALDILAPVAGAGWMYHFSTANFSFQKALGKTMLEIEIYGIVKM